MRKVPMSLITASSIALFINVSDAEASSSYTVKQGDTLWKIAAAHQVSTDDLIKWNQLKSNTIYPNQVLKLQANTAKPAPTNQNTPPTAMSTTYTIKPGDTLSKIAAAHQTTVGALQRLNNLTGHMIYAGQTIKVNGVPPAASQPVAKPNNPAPSKPSAAPNAPTGTYTVVKGDTLSAIAHKHGITVTQLQNWNGIQSHLIYVGQVLKIENRVVQTQPNTPPVVTKPPAPTNSVSVNNIVNLAMSLQGTPYVWGGASPSGFDCSGFLYYVYSKNGVDVPRTNTVGFHARSYEVDTPKVGDIVFFKNTYTTGISHAGIYLGNNKFIHAGGDRVQISSLSESYWKKHFDSFKRLYAMN